VDGGIAAQLIKTLYADYARLSSEHYYVITISERSQFEVFKIMLPEGILISSLIPKFPSNLNNVLCACVQRIYRKYV